MYIFLSFICGLLLGLFWKIIPVFYKLYVYFECKKVFNLHINKYNQIVYFKIYAIKKYKELTKKGLKESKKQIEKWFNC